MIGTESHVLFKKCFSVIFSDTISGLERVADHATNIAFAILEPEDNEEDDEEEE